MGGDPSNMSEVEDDMDVGGMSRGRCCCITGGVCLKEGSTNDFKRVFKKKYVGVLNNC